MHKNITSSICVGEVSCWGFVFLGYPRPSVAVQIFVGYCIFSICGWIVFPGFVNQEKSKPGVPPATE